MQKNVFFQKIGGNILVFRKKAVPLHPLRKKQHRGVEQLVARQAHNLEVACSSPASATTKNASVFFFLYRYVRLYFIVMQQKKEGVGIIRLLLFSYAQTFISRLISYIC